MTKEQWQRIEHFSPKENWGDPYKMDFRLISRLDLLREYIGVPIYIHYGTQGKHSAKSYHYTDPCKATDCFCRDISLLDFYLSAEKFSFGGIGIYPYWVRPGLHLDMRDLNYPTARWGRVKGMVKRKVNRVYVPLSAEFIKNHVLKV